MKKHIGTAFIVTGAIGFSALDFPDGRSASIVALLVFFFVCCGLLGWLFGRMISDGETWHEEETTAGTYAAELNRQLREEEAEVSAAATILDETHESPGVPQTVLPPTNINQ